MDDCKNFRQSALNYNMYRGDGVDRGVDSLDEDDE
jgi:hypothetical protein